MSDTPLATDIINRELSALAFNARVLAQAEDRSLPLLERLRYLCISSSNLDEFFEIRVAGLQQQRAMAGVPELLRALRAKTDEIVRSQYGCLREQVLPALRECGIDLVERQQWQAHELEWLVRHFKGAIEPVLSPMTLDPARPFPRVQNKSLNFAVQLRGHSAFGSEPALAIVQAPRSLPRILELPRLSASAPRRFAMLASVMETFAANLFPGFEVCACHAFRLTRNSDLFVDEEAADDLRNALEDELLHRRYGAAVRLEVDEDCPRELTERLANEFGLGDIDVYRVPEPVNLHRLSALYHLAERPDLQFTPLGPEAGSTPEPGADWFSRMREHDILLHHPYQSFTPVLEFLHQAARDPQVLAIKQTLYRTGDNSPVVKALIAAAQSGKDVTAVIELRARFDEEANIELSTQLQDAGAHVLYGVVGYKTHAKMCLVVRRERDGIRRYCHLGTGNYHPGTARSYTDYGLLTANSVIGQDVHEIFLQLSSLARAPNLQKLLQAPFTLHKSLLEKIEREISHARSGRPGRIVAKLNSLVEPGIIDALYKASQAGVDIGLIVRGICCLRPQVPGISDRIQVRSIVGRFLEHSRVYYFANDGAPEIWCSSADWMERNFFRRIETAFPIESTELAARVLDELTLALQDNVNAWVMDGDGVYTRLTPGDQPPRSMQNELIARYRISDR